MSAGQSGPIAIGTLANKIRDNGDKVKIAEALGIIQNASNANLASLNDLQIQISNISGLTLAEVLAYLLSLGFRATAVSNLVLTADQMITATDPTLAGDLLFINLSQDATGGWNITWDTNLLGATDQLGLTLPDTRYQFSFVGLDLGGTLTWVNFSQLLAY